MTAPVGTCEQCQAFQWQLEAYIDGGGLVERWVCGRCGRQEGEALTVAEAEEVTHYGSVADAARAKRGAIPGSEHYHPGPPEVMMDYVATCEGAVANVQEVLADAQLVHAAQATDEDKLAAATIVGLAEKLLAKRQAELERAIELRRRADIVVKLGKKLALPMRLRWRLTRLALQDWNQLTDRQWNKRLKDWHTAQLGDTVPAEGAEK